MLKKINPDDFPGMRYKIVYRLLGKQEHKRLDKLDIYHGQTKVLIFIIHNPGCKQSDLKRHYGLSAPTMAKTTKRLLEHGLIIKKPDENDGRITRIFPTEKCKQLSQKSVDLHTAVYEGAFAGFSDEEKNQFESFLKRMEINLNKQEEETI